MIGETLDQLPTPDPGDRVTLLANTGEGKSVVLDALIASQPNVIIINSKHDDQVEFAKNKRGVVTYTDGFMREYKGGRIEWRPSDEWIDSMPAKNQFFMWAFNWAKANRDTTDGLVIVIDEVNDVCPSAQFFPTKFQKVCKQGRAIKLSVYCASQEPTKCPSFAFGQAQHRYVFHIGWPTHRKTAEEWFEAKIPWDLMPERSHKFIVKTPKGTWGPQPPLELAGAA